MKVLLAVGDKEFGAAIADFVSCHCWPDGTNFRILHVKEWTPPERELTASQTLTQYLEDSHNYAVKVTGNVARTLQTKLPNCQFEEIIMEGSPAQRIIELANAWKADMIVVGSHGRKGVSLFILGSVSLGVVSNATCSVVVIRTPEVTSTSAILGKEAKQSVPVG